MRVDGSVDAKIGTSLAAPLLAAATDALAEAQAATHWGGELEPALVAILCAATAVEAATNWEAADRAPEWLQAHENDPPHRKWAGLVKQLTQERVDLGKGLGKRIAELIDDRNLIAHFRGVLDSDRVPRFFLPPDPEAGRSPVRVHFTASLAASHVTSAREAIDRLR